jgi:hypothetical protein
MWKEGLESLSVLGAAWTKIIFGAEQQTESPRTLQPLLVAAGDCYHIVDGSIQTSFYLDPRKRENNACAGSDWIGELLLNFCPHKKQFLLS